MLDKTLMTHWVLYLFGTMQLPRLTIDLSIVFVRAVLAAAASAAGVLPQQVQDAVTNVQITFDTLNTRWLAAQIEERKKAELREAYDRAQVVIRALHVHLQNIVNLNVGPASKTADKVMKRLLPNGLEILNLPAPELFGKLLGLVDNTELHFEADLLNLGAHPHWTELKSAMNDYGKLYGIHGPQPQISEPKMQKMFREMMDAVRVYFFQVMAWVLAHPEHMEVAETLLAPAGQWIELNRERNKANAKNNKNSDSQNGSNNGSDNGNSSDTNSGSANDSGSGAPDANQGSSQDESPANDAPPASSTAAPSPVPQTMAAAVNASIPEPNPSQTTASKPPSDRVTVAVPLEVRTAQPSTPTK